MNNYIIKNNIVILWGILLKLEFSDDYDQWYVKYIPTYTFKLQINQPQTQSHIVVVVVVSITCRGTKHGSEYYSCGASRSMT